MLKTRNRIHINDTTIMEDVESIQENTDDHINSMETNVCVDEETLMQHNGSDFLTGTRIICESSKDFQSELLQVTNKIVTNNSMPSPLPTKTKPVDIYKLLLAHRITYYNGEWSCNRCNCSLQNFAKVKDHLEKKLDAHKDISILDFSNIDKFSCVECEQLLKHGLIIIKKIVEKYFCVYCKCLIYGFTNVMLHIKGKNHQKYINDTTVILDIESDQKNLDDHTNNIQSNVSIDEGTSMKHVDESEFSIKVQTMYENKLLRDFLHDFTLVTRKINKYDITFHLLPQKNEDVKVYKYIMARRLTCYNEQLYCFLCNSFLQNLAEIKHHLEEIHVNFKIQVDFLKLIQLSDAECKTFLEHGFVIYGFPNEFFCVYCECSMYVRNVMSHLERVHKKSIDIAQNIKSVEQNLYDNISDKHSSISVDRDTLMKHNNCIGVAQDIKCIEQSSYDNISDEHDSIYIDRNTSMERVNQSRITEIQTMNENKLECIDKIANPFIDVANLLLPEMKFTNIYKYLVAQRLTRYNGQWYCYLCKCTLQNIEVRCHLEEDHSLSQISDFLESLADVSDMRCREVLNHGIVMRDLQYYFCIPCECPMLSVHHIDGHVKGKKHKKYIANIPSKSIRKIKNSNDRINGEQSNVSVDAETTTQDLNEPEFSTKTQTICEKKLIKSLSYNSDTEENALSSNFNEKNNENDILDTIEIVFCSLCDIFLRNVSTRKHILSKEHVSLMKIFNQQTEQHTKYIIELETKKKLIRPLQLTVRKLDDTVWPMYREFTAPFTCDKCNGIIEENDLVNHEITLHKDSANSSFLSDANNQTFSFKIKLLVHIHSSRFQSYPMFKCSFCNEIIHGVLSLKEHIVKLKHEENIIKLAQIKKEEYKFCRNAEDCLEPLEFINIISLKNNDKSLQVMEQPLIYIKTRGRHYKNSSCAIQKQFIYICVICRCIFYHANHTISHLRTRKGHHYHLENILHTYNFMYRDMYLAPPSKKFQMIEPSTHTMDMSINSGIKLEESVDERQQVNLFEIGTNIDSEDDTSYESDESVTTGLFMSPDIYAEINMLLRNGKLENSFLSPLRVVPDEISISALDYYNRIYKKKYLLFEEIMFISNTNMLEKIKSNLQFYVPRSDKNICCLVCNVTHSYNASMLFEHIYTEKHIACLTLLKSQTDNEKYRLLQELMRAEPMYTKCYACNVKFGVESSAVTTHMLHSLSHKTNRKKLLVQMENIIEEFKTLWYSIQYFACVICRFRYKRKLDFMEHLQRHISFEHDNLNDFCTRFYFCTTCATLWYSEKEIAVTYSMHCKKCLAHQYLTKTNDFAIKPLPQTVQKLLENVDETVTKLLEQAENALSDPRPNQLRNELHCIFENCNLPVKMCTFGSRVTGLALSNSDIDIYLDFGDECIDLEIIKSRSKQIQDCLRTDYNNWEIELTLERSRTPIIKLRHKLTGLYCDLSFTNGLSVENSKFIRSFNKAYPPCQKLILFLKKWMSMAALSGSKAITNYALIWLVIFYLQVEHKIPSVADLIKNHNKSKIVGGWETGVSRIIFIDIPEFPIQELLLGFFKFYGKFDYMHWVVCPLLGEVFYKISFTEKTDLPDTMNLYVSQMSSERAEYFRIDSSMCVQDPFDLAHNLTKAVPILLVKRFKQYCNESASILCNNTLSSTSLETDVTSSKKKK